MNEFVRDILNTKDDRRRMEACMKITRDIIIKMIEHGNFDHCFAKSDADDTLPREEVMATQIGKIYKLIYESVHNAESSNQRTVPEEYQADKQT